MSWKMRPALMPLALLRYVVAGMVGKARVVRVIVSRVLFMGLVFIARAVVRVILARGLS